jgi:hypothetical protein
MELRAVNLTNGIDVPISSSVTAVVGPNNAGKSTFLRELQQAFSRQPFQGPITEQMLVRGYELGPDEDLAGYKRKLSSTYQLRPAGSYADGVMHEPNWRLSNGSTLLESNVNELWNSTLGFGQLAHYFSVLMNADNRLHMANASGAYDTLRESASNAVQKLYSDRSLEASLSALTLKAFGKPITVNRYAGSQIYLHVGAPTEPESSSPQTKTYLEELAALPRVDEQGDGFRAFIGMALSVMAGAYPVVLLDEPEAFLHPPQARLLGKFLAEQHAGGTQVIVSTHSEDIIAGLTSSAGTGVSIVRLTRDEDQTSVALLTAEAVQDLYDDPLIRYYDMLNGLFVRGVVICEADSDCTYYRAVLELLDTKDGIDSGLHFTHTGGKARIHVAMEAFRRTKVPVATLVDVDFLQNDVDFERILKAVGADLRLFERDRHVVTSAVRDRDQRKTVVAARAEVDDLLKDAKGEVTGTIAGQIAKAIAGRSGWKEFKEQGKRMLHGDALSAYESLDQKLKGVGVFLVSVGELEGFHPEFSSSNKARWLRSVLEAKAYETSDAARELLKEVRQFATEQQVL